MKNVAALFVLLIGLSSQAFAEEVREVNLGGNAPVALGTLLHYPQIDGMAVDASSLPADYEAPGFNFKNKVRLSIARNDLETLLAKLGLPPIVTVQHTVERVVKEKGRCETVRLGVAAALEFETTDREYLLAAGGRCAKAANKPSLLERMRAKGRCIPARFEDLAAVARVARYLPETNSGGQPVVDAGVPAKSCQDRNIAKKSEFELFAPCAGQPSGEACRALFAAKTPVLKDGKWALELSLGQTVVVAHVLSDLVVDEPRTFIKSLSKISYNGGTIAFDVAGAGSADVIRGEGPFENFMSREPLKELTVSAEYANYPGDPERLEKKLGVISNGGHYLKNFVNQIEFTKENISQVEYFADPAANRAEALRRACGYGNWNSPPAWFYYICQYRNEDELLLKRYRIRVHFRDQDGNQRHLTYVNQAATELFYCTPDRDCMNLNGYCGFTVRGIGETQAEWADWVNGNYPDAMITVLANDRIKGVRLGFDVANSHFGFDSASMPYLGLPAPLNSAIAVNSRKWLGKLSDGTVINGLE